jgi:hypothetical protein
MALLVGPEDGVEEFEDCAGCEAGFGWENRTTEQSTMEAALNPIATAVARVGPLLTLEPGRENRLARFAILRGRFIARLLLRLVSFSP